MKIGIDARMYGKEQTGIGLYIKNLIENIAKIDAKNQYVLFLRKEHFNSVDIPAKNFKKILADSKWYSFSEQTKFLFQLLKENLDVVHFPSFNAPVFYFKKRITTIHDLTPKYFPGHKMDSLLRKAAFSLVLKRSVFASEKIIAVSNYTKDEILKHYNVSPEKIEVIYQGIPHRLRPAEAFSEGGQKENAQISKEQFLEKYKLSKPYIFYTGVWRYHKNIVGLIQAFDILKNKHKKDILLVLGGREDSFYPEVRCEWEKLDASRDIIRPGFIEDEEMGLFLENAQCFVLPSFIEGFGFGPLESLAFGTPTAVSDIPATREALGEAGLYFDPKNPEDMAEKINLVLEDEKLREELVLRGKEMIKKYDWLTCAGKTLDIYRSMI